MSLELKPAESLRKGVRRIARKLMDDVVEELSGTHERSRDKAVHEARKAFKKIRAILRLIRSATGDKTYREENTGFRDLGRPLTEVRDAHILIETLDKLAEHFKESVSGRSFGDIRKALQLNLRAVRKRVLDEQGAFGMVAEAVRQARKRIKEWADVPNRWRVVGDGLKNVYTQARTACEDAVAEPTVAKLHEWRKQTKYLRYQLEVLRPLWPERMEELAHETDRMGELLGDDHDLAVLRDMLAADPEHWGDTGDVEVVLALSDRRRAELERDAELLGQRFFQDRPGDFAGRLKGYWRTWRAQTKGRPQPSRCPSS